MHNRASRLFWICKKLQKGDRKMFEFDLPISPNTLFSDSVLLNKLGFISIELGSTDVENILHLVKMPTEKEIEKAYLNHKREKLSASFRRELQYA